MRKEGFKGKIILLTKDIHPPYDRPKAGKALNSEPESLYLRNLEYFKQIGVDFYRNTVSLIFLSTLFYCIMTAIPRTEV